jgi:hypothetical protein
MDKTDKTRKARKYGGFNTMGDESEEKITCDGMDKSYFARCRRNPKHLGVKCRGQLVWNYKGKPITNFLSAAYAAFNLVDPIPEVNHEE